MIQTLPKYIDYSKQRARMSRLTCWWYKWLVEIQIFGRASEISNRNIFVSSLGAEPMTCQATVHCSTTELQHIPGNSSMAFEQ